MGKILLLIITVLIVTASFIGYQRREINKYKSLWVKELQNVEAYRIGNSGLEGEIREHQMSMNDIRSSKDSIDRKLARVIDELKIRDKKIEYLQYQASQITKTDSVVVPDTIFINDLKVDTIVGDKWYSMRLQLNYPSTVIVTPTFNTEKYVIIDTKKEYNSTPSKIFFIRWFQKKHTVVEVKVEEKSPYITNEVNKFIKILK